MNKIEQSNYEKLVNDLSIDNLSDQEIVEMWKAPTIQQVNNGISNSQIQQFLISKGVSKDYAPKGLKWIKSQDGVDHSTTNNKVTFASIFRDMFQSLNSKIKTKD